MVYPKLRLSKCQKQLNQFVKNGQVYRGFKKTILIKKTILMFKMFSNKSLMQVIQKDLRENEIDD